MSDIFRSYDKAARAAANFELKTTIGKGFEVVSSGEQVYRSRYENGESFYELVDRYELGLDLSGNDGERIEKVKVELPGLTVELGVGWFRAETDYGWNHYVEYDSPKIWKKNVLKEES